MSSAPPTFTDLWTNTCCSPVSLPLSRTYSRFLKEHIYWTSFQYKLQATQKLTLLSFLNLSDTLPAILYHLCYSINSATTSSWLEFVTHSGSSDQVCLASVILRFLYQRHGTLLWEPLWPLKPFIISCFPSCIDVAPSASWNPESDKGNYQILMFVGPPPGLLGKL